MTTVAAGQHGDHAQGSVIATKRPQSAQECEQVSVDGSGIQEAPGVFEGEV